MTTMLVVEHPTAVRRALCVRLSLEPDLTQIREASDARSAVHLAEALRPDVIVLDAEMPGLELRDTVRTLRERSPSSVVVILSHDPAAQAGALDGETTLVVGKHEGVRAFLHAVHGALVPRLCA